MCDRKKKGEKNRHVRSAIKPGFKMSPATRVQAQTSWRCFGVDEKIKKTERERDKCRF